MAKLHEALAAHLQTRLIESVTGRSEHVIVDNRPRNVLFAGCLAPRPDAVADGLESAEDFFARLAPSAIQLRFLVPSVETLTVSVRPRCHVYYRIIPPFDAQTRRTPKPDGGTTRPEPLVKAYRKCALALETVGIELNADQRTRKAHLGGFINTVVAEAMSSDGDALRPRDSYSVPSTAISSAAAIREWCNGIPTPPQPPQFMVDIEAELRDWTDGKHRQVTVSLINRSALHEAYEKSDYWELTVFDAGLEVEIATQGIAIEPYGFSALPNSYRFDRRQWGIGVNCVSQIRPDWKQISAESVATYTQPRLDHRTLEGVDLTFASLSADPLPSLEGICEQMLEYRRTAWEEIARGLASYSEGHVFRTEFERDRSEFDRESGELKTGIELLRNPKYQWLLRAFCLANETFSQVAKSKEWRLFQLVFIVRNLAVLASREWPEVPSSDDAEVLWFPTGGGKTEAFLGLLTTALFFDRLRGRGTGVTGMIRLPLRLLSHQQFQRVVQILAAAETVRKKRGVSGRAFSVGYWIGQKASPNTVDTATAEEWEADPASCQKWRKINKCPFCGGEIQLRFNRSLWSLAHHCSSNTCGNKGDLPLYIVDDELYRFLPSVIVGTVDKLAAFGMQQRFANLFGWPLSLCPKHGYSARLECLVPNCGEKTKSVELKDPVPSLLVQDELHLLKEDLGAFDGHYETAVMGAQSEVPGGRPWKVIAATATIEQYDWQIYHLYCKPARRFPSPGPTWNDTFYSRTTSQTNRLFVGILPFNRSHINSMISALWIYHREIRALRKLFEERPSAVADILGLPAATPELAIAQLIRDYELSLTYVLTRKAGDQMAESLATQVAGYMRDENEAPLGISSLTGQTSTLEVEYILEQIEQGGRRPALSNSPVDAVVATSMISHGVDIDRFNFIAFFGMPRLTAEYIQASSRVGRRFPGLALIVFSPARERDRSHYHLFEKYHQYLERLVEPPAINRWAKFAVKHMLPGVFIGSVINVVARQLGKKLYLEREFYAALNTTRTIKLDDLIARTIRYYAPDDEHAELRDEIRQRIELFVNGLRKNAMRNLWDQTDFKPMISLRDVEEPIGFMASKYSAKAFEVWMKRRRIKGEPSVE